jgi:hypothetical protein
MDFTFNQHRIWGFNQPESKKWSPKCKTTNPQVDLTCSVHFSTVSAMVANFAQEDRSNHRLFELYIAPVAAIYL